METTISRIATNAEQRILRGSISDRGVYDAFKRFGDPSGLGPIGRYVFEIVGGYYDADHGAGFCDEGAILDRASRVSNPKHGSAICELVRSLPESISRANVLKDIHDQRREVIADKLSLALANRSPEAAELLREYQEAANPVPTGEADERPHGEVIVNALTTGAISTGREGGLIELWPPALNGRCDGGASRGHQVLIFGRPESGKTLVAINLVAGFLHQGLNVMYVANEEPARDILCRIQQRLLKRTKEEIRNNQDRVRAALAAKESLGSLHIAPLAPGSFPEIKRLVDRLQPNVLILDQLRNLRVAAATRVEELESAATEARNLGKSSGLLVISITQAGMSAEGKTALDLGDVDSSKTGIPAQADLMIGVGSSAALRAAGMLTLSLPKNKLSGDHSNFSVNYSLTTGEIT